MGTSLPVLRTLTQCALRSKKRKPTSRQGVVRRAFLIWIMMALSVLFAVNQFRSSRKMAQLSSKNEPVNFYLPDWGVQSAASNFLSSWFWTLEEDEDGSLDDDNVFDDDNSEGEDSEDAGEGSDNSDQESEKKPVNTAQDYKRLLNTRIKEVRQELEEYAKDNEGKVNPTLMEKYQVLVKRKRKIIQEERNHQDHTKYYTRKGKQFDEDARRQERYEGASTQARPNRMGLLSYEPFDLDKDADFSKYPPLPTENRVLPDMSKTGGVVFFLHVPKTGGQTIRQLNRRFKRHLKRREKMKLIKGEVDRQEKLGYRGDPRAKIPQKFDEPTPGETELEELTHNHLKYVVANTLKVFEHQAVPLVNGLFEYSNSTKDRMTLFVEVHGMDNYNALELEPYLHYWRKQSKKTGIPFFAFTILREAISLQVSFFNFYYIHPGDPRFCKNPLKPQQKCVGAYKEEHTRRIPPGGRYRRGVAGTLARHMARDRGAKKVTHENGMEDMTHEQLEEALLKVAYDSPQCLFLARGERAYGDDPDEVAQRQGLDRNECQNAYLSLQRTMDWIGKTDTLSTETLPLLMNVMFRKPYLAKALQKANESPHDGGWVKLSKASEATKKKLERLSQFDQELYHRVKEDYTMDVWANH